MCFRKISGALETLTDTEISQLHKTCSPDVKIIRNTRPKERTFPRQEDILQFDIAVQNFAVVNVLYGQTQLHKRVEDELFLQQSATLLPVSADSGYATSYANKSHTASADASHRHWRTPSQCKACCLR